MKYPYNRKQLNKELKNIAQIGTKGSYEKQQKIFTENSRSKNLYKKALELASY